MKDICIAAILCTLSFAACAAEDTSVPVRPGNPETGAPFWNGTDALMELAEEEER